MDLVADYYRSYEQMSRFQSCLLLFHARFSTSERSSYGVAMCSGGMNEEHTM